MYCPYEREQSPVRDGAIGNAPAVRVRGVSWPGIISTIACGRAGIPGSGNRMFEILSLTRGTSNLANALGTRTSTRSSPRQSALAEVRFIDLRWHIRIDSHLRPSLPFGIISELVFISRIIRLDRVGGDGHG